jgi:hypothetical protein
VKQSADDAANQQLSNRHIQDDHTPPRQRHQPVSPKHYQHVRRIAATRDVPPPTIATVYGSIEQDPCCSVSNIQLCYLSTQPHVFPETFLPNTVMLIVDTGASVSITPDAADFIEPPKSVQPTIHQGITSRLQVKGIGTMLYIFIDEEGTEVTILLPHTLYVPGCATCLLCPRHLVETTQVPNNGFVSLQNHATLKCHGKSILVEYNSTAGYSPCTHQTTTKISLPRKPVSVHRTTRNVYS